MYARKFTRLEMKILFKITTVLLFATIYSKSFRTQYVPHFKPNRVLKRTGYSTSCFTRRAGHNHPSILMKRSEQNTIPIFFKEISDEDEMSDILEELQEFIKNMRVGSHLPYAPNVPDTSKRTYDFLKHSYDPHAHVPAYLRTFKRGQ